MDENSITELALEHGRATTEMKNHARRYIQAEIKRHRIGLTFEMLEILACLWVKDGINQQELADITIKDKSSMTYLVDNLVKREMVMRAPDPNDRRNNLIFLTKQGKQLQKKSYPWLMEMYAKATVGISVEDMKKSLALIQLMNDNMKNK